ncbi:shewanella-like protein phosphatase 2 [Carica papaya]|uniref:shewanella-like protein phosphatase 2 n=1 Tax=Carica papaya TaxID=3649 RepID=UPI000B8CD6E4|nr:shewanella-like protein phosphatase 2 [Carica papaya]
MGDDAVCKVVPNLLSSFVDTFVDFSVSGCFMLKSSYLDSDKNVAKLNDWKTEMPAPDRLIAIGDVHGDLEKTKEAFRIGGLIDGFDRWIGGSTTVVQVGDVLDRGGEEIQILYFLEKLKREAARSGGKIITMNGNHELLNVDGNFKFTTADSLKEFKKWADWYCMGNRMKGLCVGLEKPKDIYEGIPSVLPGIREELVDGVRARIAALRPGGPITRRFLSNNATVLVIGDSIFVHGGLSSKHLDYGLDRINEEVKDWMNGLGGGLAPEHCGEDGVVWMRKFSVKKVKKSDCSALEHLLTTVPGVQRMIMGHTPQKRINDECDGKAIRIDVGMSRGCGNRLPEVLEITRGKGLKILSSSPA